jgi:nucleotide-binding universal stress UspA family protein
MFENILLAVDGSDHALRAASLAGDLARQMNTKEVRIVIAFDVIPIYLGEPDLQIVINARMKEAGRILKEAQESVGAIPGRIRVETLEGSPAEAVIEAAKTWRNDLIIMGSRGLGRIVGAVLGSTSQKVVAHAPCPVLIVK